MPSQQCSLRLTLTAVMCQAVIAATDAASDGPSKTPVPSTQAYCVPVRFTPSSRTGRPVPSTSRLPETRTDSAGAGPGEVTGGVAPRVTGALVRAVAGGLVPGGVTGSRVGEDTGVARFAAAGGTASGRLTDPRRHPSTPRAAAATRPTATTRRPPQVTSAHPRVRTASSA